MNFNGTEKQNKWADKILTDAKLTDEQIDNLLKWAGPTLYAKKIMDAIIVIDNRQNLAAYADSLGKFLTLSPGEKHAVAEEACGVVRELASKAENFINHIQTHGTLKTKKASMKLRVSNIR